MENKQTLPNSTGTLVLGILSIIFCSCYGVPGLVMGIIAFAISGGSMRRYRENPDQYYGYSNLQAGRVCAIIGMSLSALYILLIVGMLSMLGSDRMLEIMKNLKEGIEQQDQYNSQGEDYEEWQDTYDSEGLDDDSLYDEENGDSEPYIEEITDTTVGEGSGNLETAE